MHFIGLALAVALQVTPPPPPPVLVTPAPSPSASASPSAAPSASPAAALTASRPAVNLPPGQTQSITIGNSSGTLSASLDTPLATVSVDQAARTVTLVAGTQTGRAILAVTDASGGSIQIPVRVANPAATLPSTIALRVTGNPVDQAWLQKQVQQALMKSVQLQPGVPLQAVQLTSYSLPPSFAPGASAVVPVTVQIPGGEQFLDVNATVSVSLQNVALDPFAPSMLFYDDDPEKIAQNGVLYRGQVNPGTPGRLYYYHQNTVDARRLLVLLNAAGNQPATVQLIDSSAGPNIDVMSVGHAVSRDFLAAKPRNQGVVVDVPAGAPFVADDFQAMKPLDGAAGSLGIRVVTGGPVTVTVVAVPPNATADQIVAFASGPKLPGDGHNRTGVFDITRFGQASIAYSVGGPDAQIQYGAATPPALDPPAGHDYGEYGVMRNLTFDINNPGTAPATVYLYERPMGGVVRSSFLVDGSMVQVGCARVSERYQIGQPFLVNPGNARISVQTMTDGGSNYPLEVGMTTTPPSPSPPPITASNGCFPKPAATQAPETPATPAPEPTGRQP